jgi:hypothetical protein
MKDRELDDLMREYEAEVAAYKRLPQSEPTALLDRAILTKARAAAAHVPPTRQRPPRWIAMAASFAGVAIAASIGWRVYETRQNDTTVAASVPAARDEAFEVEVLPGNHRERGLEMAQMPAPPPPAPAAPNVAEPQAFDDRARAKQETEPSVASVAAASAPVMQKAIVPDPHQRADHGGAAAVPERRQNVAAAPAAVEPAPVAADALGALSAETEQQRDETDAQRKDAVAPPQEWLVRIRQLVRDRRYTEARTELYRFRTEYPDVVIPTDLRRYAP